MRQFLNSACYSGKKTLVQSNKIYTIFLENPDTFINNLLGRSKTDVVSGN